MSYRFINHRISIIRATLVKRENFIGIIPFIESSLYCFRETLHRYTESDNSSYQRLTINRRVSQSLYIDIENLK